MHPLIQFSERAVGQNEECLNAHALWTAIQADALPSKFGSVDSSTADARNVDGRNALMWACHLGREKWAKALSRVTNLSDVDHAGRTALMWAADSGSGLNLTWLIEPYESLFAVDSNGDTATDIAARRGDSVCSFYLLIAHRVKDSWRAPTEGYAVALDADPFHVVRLGRLELRHVEALRRRIEALGNGFELKGGGTRLHLAAAMGMLSTVDRLLQEGDDPRALGESQRTPLMEAVMNAPASVDSKGRFEVARRLLPLSDPLWQDLSGKTALMHAAEACDVQLVRLLLSVSDPNATASFPALDALGLAKKFGAEAGRECVAVLAPATGQFARHRDSKDPLGNAFRSAAMNGELSAVAAMIAQEERRKASRPISDGSNQSSDSLSHRVDQRGRDALMMAADSGKAECVAFLIEKSDPFARDNMRSTALMHAARNGHVECVKLLVGVSSLDARDGDGNTALMCAAVRGHSHVVRLLLATCRIDLFNHAEENLRALAVRSGSTETLNLVDQIEKA